MHIVLQYTMLFLIDYEQHMDFMCYDEYDMASKFYMSDVLDDG